MGLPDRHRLRGLTACETSAADAGEANRNADAEACRDSVPDADGTANVRVAAADRIYRRAESVRRDELAVALRRLEDESDLTDGQRRAVERMTEHIAASLVAPATAALRAADSEREVDAAMTLFGGSRGGNGRD